MTIKSSEVLNQSFTTCCIGCKYVLEFMPNAYRIIFTVTFIEPLSNVQVVLSIIMLTMVFFFVYLCIYQDKDIKAVMTKLEEAIKAVWKVCSNPLNLIGFITVAILVNAFPFLIKDIGSAILKTQKL